MPRHRPQAAESPQERELRTTLVWPRVTAHLPGAENRLPEGWARTLPGTRGCPCCLALWVGMDRDLPCPVCPHRCPQPAHPLRHRARGPQPCPRLSRENAELLLWGPKYGPSAGSGGHWRGRREQAASNTHRPRHAVRGGGRRMPRGHPQGWAPQDGEPRTCHLPAGQVTAPRQHALGLSFPSVRWGGPACLWGAGPVLGDGWRTPRWGSSPSGGRAENGEYPELSLLSAPRRFSGRPPPHRGLGPQGPGPAEGGHCLEGRRGSGLRGPPCRAPHPRTRRSLCCGLSRRQELPRWGRCPAPAAPPL